MRAPRATGRTARRWVSCRRRAGWTVPASPEQCRKKKPPAIACDCWRSHFTSMLQLGLDRARQREREAFLFGRTGSEFGRLELRRLLVQRVERQDLVGRYRTE